MKFTKIFLALLVLYSSILIAEIPRIPLSWIEEEQHSFTQSSTLKKSKKFLRYLDHILDYQEDVLDEVEKKSKTRVEGGVKFDSFKTDLSLTKGGILGFGSLNATSAIQLTWKRKSDIGINNHDEKLLHDLENKPVQINFSEDMTDEEIINQIIPVVELAVNSKRVKNKIKMKKILLRRVKKIHKLTSTIFEQQNGYFVPAVFVVDLSFDVQGNILNYMELGGSFRVRLGWTKKNTTYYNKSLKKNKKNKKHLKKLVSKIINQISKTVKEQNKIYAPYQLFGLVIGIGTFQNGSWGIAKTKAEALGIIYFIKNPNLQLMPTQKITGDFDIIANTNKVKSENGFLPHMKKIKIYKLKFKKFRKGLKKSFKIAAKIAKSSAKKAGKWQVSSFKTTFALTYTGFLGLSGNTSGAFTELIFIKK